MYESTYGRYKAAKKMIEQAFGEETKPNINDFKTVAQMRFDELNTTLNHVEDIIRSELDQEPPEA